MVFRMDDVAALRSFRIDMAVCLYAVFLTILSLVFPLTFAVTEASRTETHYVPLLLIYLASGSLVFLTYVSLRIYLYKQPDVIKKLHVFNCKSSCERTSNQQDKPGADDSAAQQQPPEHVGFMEDITAEVLCPIAAPESGDGLEGREEQAPFSLGGRGANFFMRMGVVAFGLGSLLLEGFRLFGYAEHRDVWRCFGFLYVLTAGIRLFTYLLQTYFLFKYQNIVLNFETSLMKLGIAHLVVFNLSGWFTTVALEADDTILKLTASNPPSLNTSEGAVQSQRLDCTQSRALADAVGGYLYPIVIAYSLLAAVLLLRIYTNIGRPLLNFKQRSSTASTNFRTPTTSDHYSHCYKSNSGLFAGLTVLLLTISSVCFFMYYNNHDHQEQDIPGAIHLLSTLVVNTCALLTLPPAMLFVQKLKFKCDNHRNGKLDDILLLLSLAGHYSIIAIMFIPCTSASTKVATVRGMSLKSLGCVCFVVDFLQSTAQVGFILDGLRRRSSNDYHVREKPGRSLVTFLLLCNLSVWLVNCLELKESYGRELFTDFYGPIAWVILLYISLPLSIFFRFHSSVCLSDIWLYAYEHPPFYRREKPKLINSTTQTFTEPE